ncbi:MAG: hypothetical protein M3Y56_05715, partial [Armatimonadota bacterium]|nr:hypothetical protein [Armatimonadota bacterium]
MGYRRKQRDPRDWLWSRLYGAAPADLPERSSTESFLGPAYNQEDTPQCVCYSIASLKHHDVLSETGRWLQFDPGAIYRECKERDGSPGEDGTTIRDAMKVASKSGLPADDGRRYMVKGYARLESCAELKHALSLAKPVMIGLQISGAELSGLGANAIASIPASTDGGHCMLVVGYDSFLNAFRVRNSWGAQWADSGHFWLPYSALVSDPEFEAWTTVCEKVAGVRQEETQDVQAISRREVSTSNFAWFDPADVLLSEDDGPDLEWKGIPRDVAQDTLRRIAAMRSKINLADLKGSTMQSARESLEKLSDESGNRLLNEKDLAAYDLCFGSQAIRIDSDGAGGYMVINGRHRLFLAKELGIQSVPVSISNLARKQLKDRINESAQP